MAGRVLCPLGFTQPKTKPKLRWKQHTLYSMARERRSRNLVHQSTSGLDSERDLLSRSKDNAGRSEINDAEAYI